ncbi:MAG: hypothetical protein NTZ74_09020 [Chloroflexi bacterium]|nr:hypothetical protein [Chloroflexota bacterium]
MDNWMNLIPVLVIMSGCIYLLLTDLWKHALISVAVIYVSTFFILIQFWSFSFSMVKMLTGLMSMIILGISYSKGDIEKKHMPRAERIFRGVALCLYYLVIVFISGRVTDYLAIPLEMVISSLFILGYGIVQLGMTQSLLKVFLALGLIIFGFELLYSTNEASLLINGLLAIVVLLVALVGGYIAINEVEGDAE